MITDYVHEAKVISFSAIGLLFIIVMAYLCLFMFVDLGLLPAILIILWIVTVSCVYLFLGNTELFVTGSFKKSDKPNSDDYEELPTEDVKAFRELIQRMSVQEAIDETAMD